LSCKYSLKEFVPKYDPIAGGYTLAHAPAGNKVSTGGQFRTDAAGPYVNRTDKGRENIGLCPRLDVPLILTDEAPAKCRMLSGPRLV